MRDVPWEYIFKLGASTAGTEFCEFFQARIDVSQRKCQVQPHSSPFISSPPKLKLRQISNRLNMVLEVAKLACDDEYDDDRQLEGLICVRCI